MKSNSDIFREKLECSGFGKAEIARIMTKRFGRPISRRTIHSWVSEKAKSRRDCPEWAIRQLEIIIDEN